ncbi:MAG: hypothetical protein P8L23_07100 [Flavobacteriales bacterium]|nr:hypothetical protein [Flavobacteriales bacterium]
MNCLKFLGLINLIISFNFSLSAQYNIVNIQNFNYQKPFDFVEIDNQGFLYFIHNDEIIKMNKAGEELYHYSNKSLGDIAELDVSNSLRPVVFYKDQALIVLLDNTLSQQEDIINLSSLSLDQSNCIGNSNFDNGIWFYDMALNEIIKINSSTQFQFKSGNLSAILPNINLPILSLKENNGKLYAQTSDEILVFDQYGSLIHNFNIQSISKPIYTKNFILLIKENITTVFEMLDFSLYTINLKSSYDYLRGNKNNLIGVKKNSVDLLELK